MNSCRLLTDQHLRQALALWACLAVAVCVKTAVCTDPHSVYPQFAASSHHWWADKSLYTNYRATEHIDGYRYSPAFAVAFTPLAYLPARLGTMIWDVASIVLLVWALHVFVRDVLPGDWPPQRESLFLMLALPGSIVGIWSGQSNALIIAAIMLALAAIVRQRWWTAAILLAVPVFIKIWPLAIVVLLVFFWPRQLVWRFAVACAVLALVPFLTRPPSMVVWQYREWYDGPDRAAARPLARIPRRMDDLGDAFIRAGDRHRLASCVPGVAVDRGGRRVRLVLVAISTIGWGRHSCLPDSRESARQTRMSAPPPSEMRNKPPAPADLLDLGVVAVVLRAGHANSSPTASSPRRPVGR